MGNVDSIYLNEKATPATQRNNRMGATLTNMASSTQDNDSLYQTVREKPTTGGARPTVESTTTQEQQLQL